MDQSSEILVSEPTSSNWGFGESLSLSLDGTVLVVGEPTNHINNYGAVYTFDEGSDHTWVQRGSILVLDVLLAQDRFGMGVAISGDGNLLVVGASSAVYGEVRTYDKAEDEWSISGGVLTVTSGGEFGFSVALSDDGTVLVVGSRLDTNTLSNEGGVRTYDRSGTTWVLRGSVLFSSTPVESGYFGQDVDISGDGLVLSVTDYRSVATEKGAVHIYDKNGTTWTERAAVVVAAGAADYALFGNSCCLNVDGSLLAVGWGYYTDTVTDQGAIILFDWGGSSWTERASPIIMDSPTSVEFGHSCAINDDATLMIAGIPDYTDTETWQGGVLTFFTPQIIGEIKEGTDITEWTIHAFRMDTMALLNSIEVDTSVDSSYSMITSYDGLHLLTCLPKNSGAWPVSSSVTLGEYIVASDPDSNPHIWKCTTAGTTGATEPSFNLSGTTTDNTAVWTYVASLVDPVSIGFKIQR